MARLARVVVPGIPHHITQRGNRRAKVFDDDESRRAYLAFVAQYARRYGVDVWAYSLMDNHVHWVVAPKAETSLAQCFRGAHTRFSMAVNAARGETGHLWQNRYFSCPLDETHLWAAVRYVERNPVRAGLVRRAEQYGWSSARAHCGLRADALLSADFPPAGVVADWREWLREEDPAQSEAVRKNTYTGRPCGSLSFVERLEGLLRRTLQLQKVGRKRKRKPNETKGLFNE
ncbi:MAG: transposase [Planctomycetota bacterium]|nr:transposase [Planctomycetota bacterium]